MEAITKKTITVEFRGRNYTLQEDSTMADLVEHLGLPKDQPVRLQYTGSGFVLVCNNG